MKAIISSIVKTAAFVSVAMAMGVAAGHADSLAEIEQNKTIRIAIDLAAPPYGMLDSDLKPSGSDVEIAQLLAADWGLKIDYVQTTGATRIPNLLTNKADIVIASLSITDERREVIDFSAPYAVARAVLGAPKATSISGVDDLRGLSVSVTRGTHQDTSLTAIAEEKGFTVARYDDDATMITAAVSGQAQAVGTGESLLAQITERNETLAFEPKFILRSTDIAIGVRKGDDNLKAKLDEWVAVNIGNGKLSAIWEKYHGIPLPAEFTGKN